MGTRVGLVMLIGTLFIACGGAKAPANQSTGKGSVRLVLTGAGIEGGVTIAVRNVFDPGVAYVVDCPVKDHLLAGQAFCDEMLVVPAGVYDVVVQAQDPACHSERNFYKEVVPAGQTVEVPVALVCDDSTGGLDVVVTRFYRPAITHVTYTVQESGLVTNNFICQCDGDVRIEFQVADLDTACSDLTVQWQALDSTSLDVTASLLSDFQRVDGAPCRFSARINAGMPIDTYRVKLTVSDGVTETVSTTEPVSIMDCGVLCNPVEHTNTATAQGTYNGAVYTSSDPAYFVSNGPLAGGTPPIHAPLTGAAQPVAPLAPVLVDSVNLGDLPHYLLFFADGSVKANWQGATHGFAGDVAIDGIAASESTAGFVPYAGTMYTNDASFGPWQQILDDNPTQSSGVTGEAARIAGLENDLVNAITTINGMTVTPGYAGVSAASLDGLNTQNGVPETFVINVTSGFTVTSQIDITGDPGDVFILRWDTNLATPGYQGQVKFSSGGAIVPHGGLTPANFIHVAGDIAASGGGTTPPPPYPQGPRPGDGTGPLIEGGSDFNGGGFYTGYWLTTGEPTTAGLGGLLVGPTASMSNLIVVGGWYTLTTSFSMTSGTSGVYVSPNPGTNPAGSVDVEKYVSPDNGLTWYDADTAPGAQVLIGTNPRFKFVVTNTGNQPLTQVNLTDDVYGNISLGGTLAVGGSDTFFFTGTWAAGQHVNTATVTARDPANNLLTDSDPANWFGTVASILVKKYVWDPATSTWDDAQDPIGPVLPVGNDPQYRFVVTNNGTATLLNVTLVDNVLGPIDGVIPSLAPAESQTFVASGTWAPGLHPNIVTATGHSDGQTLTATDPAWYFGAQNPAIDVQKYVSVDNGTTWFDADTPPGPYLPDGVIPQFKFVLTNTGGAPFTGVTLTDTVFGGIASVALLMPGDSLEYVIVGLP